MFIQLIQVVDKDTRKPILVNVHNIAYIEADTPEEWCAVYFAAIAVDRSDDVVHQFVMVEETYEHVKTKVVMASAFPAPVATT
jgi:hypothetical protein